MAGKRDITVLAVDAQRLRVLSGEAGGGVARVLRWHVADRPRGLAADDAQGLGAWLSDELRRAEISRSRVVLCVPRNEVILKSLSIPMPTTGTLEPEELAGMVELQMVRQLTLPMQGTSVDYLAPGEGADVLAGAMPGDRLAWWKSVAVAASMKLARVTISSLGSATLLADASRQRDGAVLGVAMQGEQAELVIVEAGRLTHSRVVDMPAVGEGVARLSVPLKRAWMAYRGVRPIQPDALVMLDTSAEAGALAESAAAELGCSPLKVDLPGGAQLPPGMPEGERAGMLPLLGVLVEDASERATLDFLNPRRAPDVSAQRRKNVLVAGLALILLGGGLYVVADLRLGKLRAELAAAREKESELRGDMGRYLVDHARISHLETWRSARTDWLGHVAGLTAQLPDPAVSTLDELSARMAASVQYSGGDSYPSGTWKLSQDAAFDLSGHVVDRQIVSDLRDSVLDKGLYSVESRGADTPDRFSFRLTTSRPTPPPPQAPKSETPAPAGAKKGGGS